MATLARIAKTTNEDVGKGLTPEQLGQARQRFREGLTLQAIESNPLDEEDIALFEMFDRKGWSHERCIAYLNSLAQDLVKRSSHNQ